MGSALRQLPHGLSSFRGVDRRFQIKGKVGGVTIVDDYGHHPTEIRATLQAARECGYGRVLVMFQPHRYTRTRDLLDEFATAFGDADVVKVLDVYAASELPIKGIHGFALAERIRSASRGHIAYAPSMAEAVGQLIMDAPRGAT